VFVPEYPTIDKRRYGILMIGLAESHVFPCRVPDSRFRTSWSYAIGCSITSCRRNRR